MDMDLAPVLIAVVAVAVLVVCFGAWYLRH